MERDCKVIYIRNPNILLQNLILMTLSQKHVIVGNIKRCSCNPIQPVKNKIAKKYWRTVEAKVFLDKKMLNLHPNNVVS